MTSNKDQIYHAVSKPLQDAADFLAAAQRRVTPIPLERQLLRCALEQLYASEAVIRDYLEEIGGGRWPGKVGP